MTRSNLHLSAVRSLAPLAALGGSLALWSAMPDPMPIHWGIDGRPDGFAPRAVGLLLLPLVAFVLPTGIAWMAGRDASLPPRARRGIDWTLAGTAAFLSAIHGFALHAALTADGVLSLSWVTGLLGALLVVVGASMDGIEPNRWIGTRTAATLRDPAIWTVVHRATSRGFAVVGGASIVAALALPAGLALAVAIGGALLVGLGSLVLAWSLARARG